MRVAEELNVVTGQIVDSAVAVHMALGPGLLESVYETCLSYELRTRGLEVKRQVALPVLYKQVRLDAGYRIDLLVNSAVIVELKTVDKLLPIHDAQLLSYLRLNDNRVGLLINFHVPLLKDGIGRMVNGL